MAVDGSGLGGGRSGPACVAARAGPYAARPEVTDDRGRGRPGEHGPDGRWDAAADAALAGRGRPWAVVVIVHGLGEHGGRYEHVGAPARGRRNRGPRLRPARVRRLGRRARLRRPLVATLHDDLEARLRPSGRRAPACRSSSTATRFGGLVAHRLPARRTAPAAARPRDPLGAGARLATVPAWKRSVATGLGARRCRASPSPTASAGRRCPAIPRSRRRYRPDPLGR